MTGTENYVVVFEGTGRLGDEYPTLKSAMGAAMEEATAEHRAVVLHDGEMVASVYGEDDPDNELPALYQRYELEALLGEPGDFDIDDIERKVTWVCEDGKRYWRMIDVMAAIAEIGTLPDDVTPLGIDPLDPWCKLPENRARLHRK